VGAGLRLKTPFGPIRVDLGYSLKDLPYDKRNQFFITIGNPF
jgi:outer membrane translocation and assembly module TamA